MSVSDGPVITGVDVGLADRGVAPLDPGAVAMVDPDAPPKIASDGAPVPPDAAPKIAPGAVAPGGTCGTPPPRVASALAKHSQLRKLFNGTKKGSGWDGNPLGSSESYDFEFTLALVKKGIDDVVSLEGALRARPRTAAEPLTDAYLAATIAAVMDLVCPSGGDPDVPAEIPFNLEKVTRFGSHPPTYTLTIDGVDLVVTSEELLDRQKFKTQFFARLHRTFPVPTGPGATDAWDDIVNQISQQAVEILPPAQGTHRGALHEAVERAIEALPIGATLDDVREARGYVARDHSGTNILLFHMQAIIAQLAAYGTKPDVEAIAAVLVKLGCKSGQPRIHVDGNLQVIPFECYWAPASAERVAVHARSVEIEPSGVSDEPFFEPPPNASEGSP